MSRIAGFNWHVFMKNCDNDEKALYVAWIFGEARWFVRLVSGIAYKATLGEDGRLIGICGQPWKIQDLPATIIGTKSIRVGWLKVFFLLTTSLQQT